MRIDNKRETKTVLTIEDVADGDVFFFTDDPTTFYMKGYYNSLLNVYVIDLQRGSIIDIVKEKLEYRTIEKVNAVLTIE